jgi:hypothetical protein
MSRKADHADDAARFILGHPEIAGTGTIPARDVVKIGLVFPGDRESELALLDLEDAALDAGEIALGVRDDLVAQGVRARRVSASLSP